MVKTNNIVKLPLSHIINNYHININEQYPILLSDIILWLVTNTLPLPITNPLRNVKHLISLAMNTRLGFGL